MDSKNDQLNSVLTEFMNERWQRDEEIEEIKHTAGNTIRRLLDQNKLGQKSNSA